MAISEKARAITDALYERHGTAAGSLFGIGPQWKTVVSVIVDLTVRATEKWDLREKAMEATKDEGS